MNLDKVRSDIPKRLMQIAEGIRDVGGKCYLVGGFVRDAMLERSSRDFDVEVSIDNRNDVAFHMLHDGVRRSLGSGSGLEQTVASLALRSVLSKMSTFSKPCFVVFDEILGGVADENYDNVKRLYDKIVKDYSFIIQISHLSAIADWHNVRLIVKKENNVSTIYQC